MSGELLELCDEYQKIENSSAIRILFYSFLGVMNLRMTNF